MPNAIKYNVSPETLALKEGNFWIGTGDVSKGPSVNTNYWNGITPPTGGYTIYLSGVSQVPVAYVAANDAELISLTNRIGTQNFTTVEQCLSWYLTQPDKMVLNRDYESIVTDGLVLNLDAGFFPSYPKSGTTWYDVSSGGNNGTLINAPSYSSPDGGSIKFDGTNDYVGIPFNSNLVTNTLTLNMWLYPVDGYYPIPFAALPNSSTLNGFMLYQRNVENLWWWAIGNTSGTDLVTTSLTRNVWVNLTGTYNGSTIRLYKNGSLVSTGSSSRTINFTSASVNGNLRIASDINSAYLTFSGNVSTVQIYNKALSETEVLQNFNAQKGRFGL